MIQLAFLVQHVLHNTWYTIILNQSYRKLFALLYITVLQNDVRITSYPDHMIHTVEVGETSTTLI